MKTKIVQLVAIMGLVLGLSSQPLFASAITYRISPVEDFWQPRSGKKKVVTADAINRDFFGGPNTAIVDWNGTTQISTAVINWGAGARPFTLSLEEKNFTFSLANNVGQMVTLSGTMTRPYTDLSTLSLLFYTEGNGGISGWVTEVNGVANTSPVASSLLGVGNGCLDISNLPAGNVIIRGILQTTSDQTFQRFQIDGFVNVPEPTSSVLIISAVITMLSQRRRPHI